jgi:cytochrome c-type biogenesis protein CcmH/NrfF
MRQARRLCVAALATLLLTAAGAAAKSHLNAYSLEGQFICVSCHEPLNQVNSPEAVAEKQTLSGLVNQGLTFNQIKAQMVDTYTEEVLASPPAHGVSLLVYILPPLFLVCGLGFLVYNLPRWRRRAQLARQNETADAVLLDPVDADRLAEELRAFDA